MRVIALKALKDFWGQYPDSEQALMAWYQEAKDATWANSAEVKAKYRTASIISGVKLFL